MLLPRRHLRILQRMPLPLLIPVMQTTLHLIRQRTLTPRQLPRDRLRMHLLCPVREISLFPQNRMKNRLSHLHRLRRTVKSQSRPSLRRRKSFRRLLRKLRY